MITEVTKIVDILKNVINNDNEIDLCILYGSAVKNKLKTNSDIDVVVGHSKGIHYKKRLDLSIKLSKIIGREVSLLDIGRMNGLILREVLIKGLTIKNKNPLYKAKQIIKMLDFVEDILPFQKKCLLKKARLFAYGK